MKLQHRDTFCELELPVSAGALHRLHKMADQQGNGLPKAFRRCAGRLLTDPAPRFNVSGNPTERTLIVGMYSNLADRLHAWMAARGLPPAALGELVASYILPETL
ncbi:hypothetical protein BKK81_05385 [Cupriavidus sp. USMAHM13]|nr:hypothetical protein BKK81_05385 [Cupriavidus sp. USMAHM13]